MAPRADRTTHPVRFAVAARDAFHCADLRVGPTLVDSVVGYSGDDFFNVHNTLLLVLSCEAATKSCLLVNPHVARAGALRNTVYGTTSALSGARHGDYMSFFAWPAQDMVPLRVAGGPRAPLRVVGMREVRDNVTLAAAALLPELLGGATQGLGKDWRNYTNATVKWTADEVWRVVFNSMVPPAAAVRGTIVSMDTIAGDGAMVVGNTFVNTSCNLGRFKSSRSVLANNTFHNATMRNLELTFLPQFLEGPVDIHDVEVSGNVFTGEGPSPLHCGPLCETPGCSGTYWPNASIPPPCQLCTDCSRDTPWTRAVRVHGNIFL